MLLAAFYHPILATLFGLLALFLMMVILLQRGKGVGLAGAFGGAGGQTAFGSKTGDVLTWATVVIASVFLLYSVILNYIFVPQGAGLGTGVPAITSPTPAAPGATQGVPIELPTLPAGDATGGSTTTDTGAAPSDALPAGQTPPDDAAPAEPPSAGAGSAKNETPAGEPESSEPAEDP